MRRMALALLTGLLLVGRVSAATISVQSYDTAFTMDAVLDGSTYWVYTGAFRLNISGYSNPQEAWCVDLRQTVASTSWNAVQKSTLPTALDDNRRADRAMGVLWKNLSSVTTPKDRAALQIAIWEALYDGLTSDPFSTGRFRAPKVFQGTNRNQLDSSVLTLAQSYLNTWGGIEVLNGVLFDAPLPGSGTRSQDFLLSPPSGFQPLVVPEGGTLALTIPGLLAVAGSLLRQRRG